MPICLDPENQNPPRMAINPILALPSDLVTFGEAPQKRRLVELKRGAFE